jgi:hypothetical protein
MSQQGVIVALLTLAASALLKTPLSFSVTCPPTAYSGTERVSAVVYLSKAAPEPMFGPDWFHPEPIYSAKAEVKAGQPVVMENATAVGFPATLSKLEPGEYTVQAVVDRNLGGRAIASSPGNYYSFPQRIQLNAATSGEIDLKCTVKVPEPDNQDSDRIKYVKFPSKLLTDFYHRPTFIKAALGLPDAYLSNRTQKFPTVYEIPGFGGSVDNADEVSALPSETVEAGQSFVHILLDPNCPTGHCVFADSANNGPWGTALVDELIPYLERTYRLEPKPTSRFLTGHSSGGWSSLYVQVTHPDFFGGVWSTSPDPVDFTDFQMIDLYAKNQNMFFDSQGHQRPLAREGDQILAYYKPFSDMERPIRGEQLGSFEAVFSPKTADGSPQKLWDRDTGKVDPAVATAWQKYDISLILRHHWPELAPKLKGKLHVYCGSEDTFYLDGAVRKLKATMNALNSDASIELFPGNHFTVMTATLKGRIASEMADRYRSAQ